MLAAGVLKKKKTMLVVSEFCWRRRIIERMKRAFIKCDKMVVRFMSCLKNVMELL